MELWHDECEGSLQTSAYTIYGFLQQQSLGLQPVKDNKQVRTKWQRKFGVCSMQRKQVSDIEHKTYHKYENQPDSYVKPSTSH
jgi:hypothetical protein